MSVENIMTAYDTLACRGFVRANLEESIKKAAANGNIQPLSSLRTPAGNILAITEDSGIFYVSPIGAGSIVPAFVHPIAIKLNGDNRESVIVDVRPFLRRDDHTASFVIKNEVEFKSMALYGRLTRLWCSYDGRRLLKNITGHQVQIFSSWVSEGVMRSFALNPKEQLDLNILAGIYYYGLFNYENQHSYMTEREVNNLASAVSKAIHVKPQDVFDMIENNEIELPIKGSAEFCKLSEKVTGSVRLKEFAESAGALFSIVGGTWFGSHARELTAVALEYPPAFIAIIATAMTERTYKNSAISKITDRLRDNDKKLFFGSMNYALSSFEP